MRSVVTSLQLLMGRVIGGTKGDVPTTLADHYADRGNAGAAETDLYADPVPPDATAHDGDKVEARYGGVVTAGTRQIRVYFAGTLIYDTGSITYAGAASWAAYVTLTRAGAGVCRYMVTFATANPTFAPTSVGELSGVDLTTTNVLKITGQGSSTNDVVAVVGFAEYKPRVQ